MEIVNARVYLDDREPNQIAVEGEIYGDEVEREIS